MEESVVISGLWIKNILFSKPFSLDSNCIAVLCDLCV